MSIPHRLKLFPFPLLTFHGVLLLSGVLLSVPFIGLFADIQLSRLLEIVGVFSLGVLLYFLFEYSQQRKWLRSFAVSAEMPSYVPSGCETELRYELSFAGKSSRFYLEVRPEVPMIVQPGKEILSFSVNAGDSGVEFVYQFTPLGRGPIEWKQLYFRIIPQHRLFRWQFEAELLKPITAVAVPDSGADSRSLAAFRRLNSGALVVFGNPAGGREFDSLKKYAVGDDLRRVDWKRSARGKGVQVKVYRPETHQRINLALDCSRRMGNRIGGRLQLDYAADAAAQLIKLADTSEDEVGLFAFSHKVLTKIACRRGSRQEKLLLDALTNITQGELEPDYQLLAEWAQMNRRRSLLILVTSVSTPAGMDGILNALMPAKKKHLPIVFAVADRDVQELIQSKASNLLDAYTIAAAMEQLEEIQQRAQQLKRSGIECIYCDAAMLPEMMRQKYRELKLSGRL